MNSSLFRTAALAVALGGAGMALQAAPAHATSFAEMSVEQFTDASTYIVQGTVLEVWTTAEDGYVWTHARLKVTDTLKGPRVPSELVIDSMGGTYGQLTTYIPGAAQFSVGETLFAFLHETPQGLLVPVSKFQGKYTLRRAPGETRKHALRWHGVDRDRFDHRFLPHPKAEDRLYADTLVEQVQRRLDAGWDGKPIPGIDDKTLREVNTLDRRMPR